ncbi:MAG: hypothetical protein LBC86_03185 [Oscillospiraceae bacterium]|jgi:hypothetical protein|nr:hypothetical protein [Oscillospiraceae bacterium]
MKKGLDENMKGLIFFLGFAVGVIAGIYISPIKNGVKITTNNYNQCDGKLIKEMEGEQHEEIHNELNSA